MSGLVRTSEEIRLRLRMNTREIMPGGWGETQETQVPECLVSFCKWAGLGLPVSTENCNLRWAFVSPDLLLVLELDATLMSYAVCRALRGPRCYVPPFIIRAHLGTVTWVATFSNRYTSQLLMRLWIQEEGFSGAPQVVLDRCFLETRAEGSASSLWI